MLDSIGTFFIEQILCYFIFIGAQAKTIYIESINIE